MRTLRWQLMQEYVQKSTSTTLPLSPAIVCGELLIQASMFSNSGVGPQSRSWPWSLFAHLSSAWLLASPRFDSRSLLIASLPSTFSCNAPV